MPDWAYQLAWVFTRDGRGYLFAKTSGDASRLATYWCRYRGHKAGIVFYNAGGLEPDYHCQNCGDDLG